MNELIEGGERIESEGKEKKKRGRKKSEEVQRIDLEGSEQSEKSKFFIDLGKEPETVKLISKLLVDANKKSFGREIMLKDLLSVSLSKITAKDLELVQERTLTDMEKVERLLVEYNEKNGTKLTLPEFLVKKLNI